MQAGGQRARSSSRALRTSGADALLEGWVGIGLRAIVDEVANLAVGNAVRVLGAAAAVGDDGRVGGGGEDGLVGDGAGSAAIGGHGRGDVAEGRVKGERGGGEYLRRDHIIPSPLTIPAFPPYVVWAVRPLMAQTVGAVALFEQVVDTQLVVTTPRMGQRVKE